MPATPSLSQLRAHLSALLPSKQDPESPAGPAGVVVAADDPATLAETLEILSDPADDAEAGPEIQSGTGAPGSALPHR